MVQLSLAMITRRMDSSTSDSLDCVYTKFSMNGFNMRKSGVRFDVMKSMKRHKYTLFVLKHICLIAMATFSNSICLLKLNTINFNA